MGTVAEAAAELRAIARRLADMTPILRPVAADIETYIDDRFETQTAPDGSAWPELGEMALAQRARRARGVTRNTTVGPLRPGERRSTARRWTRRVAARFADAVFNAKPLNDTGRLRRSNTTSVGPRSLSFGTNAVYAAKQYFGDPENRVFGKEVKPVPSRQALPVGRDGRSLEPASFWDPQLARIERWLATGEVT